jgi:vacuolar-type H+-ATPase subunit H
VNGFVIQYSNGKNIMEHHKSSHQEDKDTALLKEIRSKEEQIEKSIEESKKKDQSRIENADTALQLALSSVLITVKDQTNILSEAAS